MAEALSQQLARSLAVSPAEAEAALERIGRHLLAQLEATGRARLQGLGTFRRAEGALAFEPEEALALAVNHRYAGLPPIEAGPPRRAAPPALPSEEPEPSEDPFAQETEPELVLPPPPKPAPEAPEPSPRAEEPAAQQATEMDDVEMDDVEIDDGEIDDVEIDDGEMDEMDEMIAGVWTPPTGPEDDGAGIGPLPPDALEEADFSLVEEPEPPIEAPAPLAETTPEPPAVAPPEPLAPAVAATVPPEPVPDFYPEPEPRRPRRAPLLALLVLLAVAGAALAWWLLERSEAPEPVADEVAEAPAVLPPPAALPPPAEEAPEPAEGEVAEAPAPAAPEAPEPEIPEPEIPEPEIPEPEAPPTPESRDPLRGGDIEPARGGVTWVVASEASRAAAEQKAARYRAEGFRAGVVAGTVRGRTYYRVGLGQFGSLEEAQRHRAQLPADAPDSTWPLNL